LGANNNDNKIKTAHDHIKTENTSRCIKGNQRKEGEDKKRYKNVPKKIQKQKKKKKKRKNCNSDF
jgi:hypothetical protein